MKRMIYAGYWSEYMHNYIEKYWKKRLEKCLENLENNNFETFLADDCAHANRIVFQDILPKLNVKTVSWGDSMTLHATKILEGIKENPAFELLETFDPSVAREEIMERRRKALLSDLFFTGTNALTETGKLVNLDMVGNRVGAITFGPKHVILLIGRNKIVPDVDAAMKRIKSYAAPVNAIRHPNLKTPCVKTSYCMDCKSPDRICNTWVITEKSFPKGRTKVVLINEELGL